MTLTKGLLTILAVTAATAAQADALFTAADFATGDYTLGFAGSQGGATFVNDSCAGCGNPGSALHLTISAADGSNFGGAVINPLFTYDPSAQGAIATINASVDKNLTAFAPELFSYGIPSGRSSSRTASSTPPCCSGRRSPCRSAPPRRVRATTASSSTA